MSMKSTTRRPPRSRNRIWRAISGAASRFVAYTVSSNASLPTNFPVLTSIATSASVCWMTIDPPEGRSTCRRSPFAISSSIPNASKSGGSEGEMSAAGYETGRKGAKDLRQPLEGRPVVDPDSSEIPGHEIPYDPKREVELPVEQGRGRGPLRLPGDAVRAREQVSAIRRELGGARPGRGGPGDQPAAARQFLEQL